jgi:hypothetical protein
MEQTRLIAKAALLGILDLGVLDLTNQRNQQRLLVFGRRQPKYASSRKWGVPRVPASRGKKSGVGKKWAGEKVGWLKILTVHHTESSDPDFE